MIAFFESSLSFPIFFILKMEMPLLTVLVRFLMILEIFTVANLPRSLIFYTFENIFFGEKSQRRLKIPDC